MNRRSLSRGEPRNHCDVRGVCDIEVRGDGESGGDVWRGGGRDVEKGCDRIYPAWSSFDSGMTSLISLLLSFSTKNDGYEVVQFDLPFKMGFANEGQVDGCWPLVGAGFLLLVSMWCLICWCFVFNV